MSDQKSALLYTIKTKRNTSYSGKFSLAETRQIDGKFYSRFMVTRVCDVVSDLTLRNAKKVSKVSLVFGENIVYSSEHDNKDVIVLALKDIIPMTLDFPICVFDSGVERPV